ncbi:GNAT family N-acetyltransferase [Burkholderia stagnalis]|uniref:GNAT family N-acetyltransferase n=1 Tax=Burkholderia stagnalis TaxID=1503054 RepID=UPI0018C6F323|nr:GNAT family N-acetyltransferase [Burkholderia stagnalis]
MNPEIYCPHAIVRHHLAQRWLAVLAEVGNQCIGHAALCRPSAANTHAELALLAVHPEWCCHGIATSLARYLMQKAHSQSLQGVEIKQVSSHDYSQRLATTLGFSTIAVLPDYVASPFTQGARESILLGYATFAPRPLPALDWPDLWRPWVNKIEASFGTCSPSMMESSMLPWSVRRVMHRVDVIVDMLTEDRIAELVHVPEELHYLSLPMCTAAPSAMLTLRAHGFRAAGLVPHQSGGWRAWMVRGHRAHDLTVRCPTARALLAECLDPASSETSAPAKSRLPSTS